MIKYQSKKNPKKKFKLGLGLFFWVFSSLSGHYAGAATETDLHLKSFLELGYRNALSMKNQKNTLLNAQDSKKTALAQFFPTISMSAGKTITTAESLDGTNVEKTTTTSNTAAVSAQWTLWDNYQTIRNYKLASMSEEAEVIRTDDTKDRYLISLLDSYLEYLLTVRRIEILEQQLAQARATLEESNALVRIGARTRIESMDSELQVINSERDLLELKQAIRLSRRNLQILLGQNENYQVPTMEVFRGSPTFVDKARNVYESLKSKKSSEVVAETRSYKLSKTDLEKGLEQLRQTELSYWPQTGISVSHQWNLDNFVADNPVTRKALQSTNIYFTLSWSLWDWFSTSRSIESSQRDYQSNFNRFREDNELNIARFESVLEGYPISEKSVKASEIALEKAKLQNQYAREMYKMGRITLLEMQQASSRLQEAEISLAQRRKSFYILSAQLLSFNNINLLDAL